MILAGIDIGTNTLRLLIAETGPDSFRQLYSDRRITRLGQDLARTGEIAPEAGERSLAALLAFSERIFSHAALRSTVVGTSALRNASNSRSFIQAVKQRTGLDVSVITGDEEARLTRLGVTRALPGGFVRANDGAARPSLIIDIGGGSTEIIITRAGAAPVVESLPLGAVYLTERFITHDPPTSGELAALRNTVRQALDLHAGMMRPDPAGVFIGTAGTITTLAAIAQGLSAYDPDRINGYVLTRDFIDDIVLRLGSSTLGERKRIRGLEQGHEDIILAGAVIAQEILRRSGHVSMIVSDGGLREGIVLDLYEKITRGTPAGNRVG
jgi:exopolyphosphatase / guanosine-5'-triphosphate,3'-diphosphate pyrophosphatase